MHGEQGRCDGVRKAASVTGPLTADCCGSGEILWVSLRRATTTLTGGRWENDTQSVHGAVGHT